MTSCSEWVSSRVSHVRYTHDFFPLVIVPPADDALSHRWSCGVILSGCASVDWTHPSNIISTADLPGNWEVSIYCVFMFVCMMMVWCVCVFYGLNLPVPMHAVYIRSNPVQHLSLKLMAYPGVFVAMLTNVPAVCYSPPPDKYIQFGSELRLGLNRLSTTVVWLLCRGPEPLSPFRHSLPVAGEEQRAI